MSETTQLDRIESMLRKVLAQTATKRPGDDEKIFRDPKEKYWQGPSYIGSTMSQCPSEYLRAYAKYKNACAFMARKEGDPEKAKYAERDDATAKLASAWAEFQEAGGTMTKPTTAPAAANSEDDCPF